ncbi:MAG TPA: TonB-dependent receptor [Gemmatimonadaceae bacterium]|nr:TonB-dependent receptor [Gemmatimonadaceae bacterium]
MNRTPRVPSARAPRRWAGKVLLAASLSPAVPLLAQQRPAALDTVTVVASRTRAADAARSVQVVSRDEIARSAARNVADVLSTVMGVDVYGRSAAQADVSIRGSSSEQIVVLVDGVRMSDAQSAHYTLGLAVPLASVERIEILRGAGSALYGPDAIGGVINIVTRRTQTSQLRARSGSFGSVGGALSTGMSRDAFTVTTAADFDKSDGHRDGTDFRIGQGRVSVSSRTPGGVVQTNLAVGVRDFGAADFYAPYNSIERTATTTLDSRWNEAIGSWTLGVTGSTRRHQDQYVLVRGNPALYENRHESWQSTGSVVATRNAGPVALAVGTEGVHDQLSSARLGGRREWRGALFGEATAGDPEHVTTQVGVRGDHSSVYGDFLSPSVSAGASLSRRVRLHASGGVGFRAPTWTERFYTDPSNRGDPNLRPERFWTGDLGVRGSAGAWALDVTGFTRRATNLIDWVKPAGASTSVPWQTMNVGEATYHGIEAALELPTVNGVRTSLFADGVSLDASQGDALVGKYALRPITRQAALRLASPPERSLTAQIDVTLARRALEDGYVTGNARLGSRHGAYRLTLDVQNLTNADWLDASGKPAAGRGVYGGFEWVR